MFCLPGCQNCQKRQNPLLAVLTFLAEGLEKTGGKHEDGSSHQGGGSNRSIHRGHGPKIQEAVAALEACGELPRNLRPVTRDRLILNWLTGRGYAADLPSRSALARYFDSSGCNASKSGETVGAETDRRTYVGPATTSSRSSIDAQHPDA